MKALRLLALAAVIVAPCVARAADVPVTYTCQEKPLKAAIAGTMLTFTLYNDSACTNQVYSTGVLIENVALITKLKQFTPKNDTKLPNTVALQHTLPNVTAVSNLYLAVTGTGVTPVGGACQAQGVLVAVASCTDGAQNQGESDVDCGGATTCPRCPNGDSCVGTSDCTSHVCMGGTCQVPTCSDGVKNGNETGVDCGGGTCLTCGSGQGCLINADCTSNVCNMNTCF